MKVYMVNLLRPVWYGFDEDQQTWRFCLSASLHRPIQLFLLYHFIFSMKNIFEEFSRNVARCLA